MKTYQVIARTLGALHRCELTPDTHADWIKRHTEHLAALLEDFPSGSGFDNGTKLDDASTPEKLIFNAPFHHMNDGGYYDGWTQHQIIVTPSLEMEYRLRITGPDRNQIKEYIRDAFACALDPEAAEFDTVTS